jgi:hypothetical protein
MSLDHLVMKAEHQHHLLNAGAPEQVQMPLKEAPAVELQQALGQLRFGLL